MDQNQTMNDRIKVSNLPHVMVCVAHEIYCRMSSATDGKNEICMYILGYEQTLCFVRKNHPTLKHSRENDNACARSMTISKKECNVLPIARR